MTDNALPDDLSAFIVETFWSIAELEALLLLCRDPTASWSTARLAARLYISEDEARRALAHLCEHRLAITADDEARFAPTSDADRERVALLVRYYTTHLIPITNLIHAKRASRIQEFADAFKLKKAD